MSESVVEDALISLWYSGQSRGRPLYTCRSKTRYFTNILFNYLSCYSKSKHFLRRPSNGILETFTHEYGATLLYLKKLCHVDFSKVFLKWGTEQSRCAHSGAIPKGDSKFSAHRLDVCWSKSLHFQLYTVSQRNQRTFDDKFRHCQFISFFFNTDNRRSYVAKFN